VSTVTYAAAMAKALEDALDRDERVVLVGNRYGGIGPHQAHFDRVAAKHPNRVIDPPWSEIGVIGASIGASCNGLRPIVDVATASFVFQAFSQLVNEAPNVRMTSGGKTRAPLVVHMQAGVRGGGGAQHSHSPQAMLWNTPGLNVVLPSRPADAYGLILTALLESEDPTVVLTHSQLFGMEEDVDFAEGAVPFGSARIARPGSDLTIVATSIMVGRALRAAETLAEEHGVDAEVLDLRTLAPLDEQALDASVRRTGRLVVADECHRSAGAAAEVVARVVESSFDALVAPPERVTTADVPVPFSAALEQAITASPERVAAAALRVLGRAT
jgi:pyruvate/2-oxoglutarate/acetoin dehydrogenase E1 component